VAPLKELRLLLCGSVPCADAGFVFESCERIEFRSAALEPRLSYILGSARRP